MGRIKRNHTATIQALSKLPGDEIAPFLHRTATQIRSGILLGETTPREAIRDALFLEEEHARMGRLHQDSAHNSKTGHAHRKAAEAHFQAAAEWEQDPADDATINRGTLASSRAAAWSRVAFGLATLEMFEDESTINAIQAAIKQG